MNDPANHRTALGAALAARPRADLALRPTPLERGPRLPGGARLWVKRDDTTGLGLGGNKARKLEFLCGAAQADGADTLVTVGAGQSNHARMTAAAGAVLGMPTHLVLGGAREPLAGNQLLAVSFGAELHFPGTDDWGELEAAAAMLASELRRDGRRPYVMPVGGSTSIGARGFAAAWLELVEQCDRLAITPAAVVHATSTAGTHAGLVAGRAAAGPDWPIVAIDVAKIGVGLDDLAVDLARRCLADLGLDPERVGADDAVVDTRWSGPEYAVPTKEGDAAIAWAARHGGWVLDRVYTGKAFAGLLGLAEEGRFASDDDVVFWHTGGHPAVFAPHGHPLTDDGTGSGGHR